MKNFIKISDREIPISSIENAWQGELSRRSIPLSAPRRFHGFLYIISGECDYFFENKVNFTAKPGDVFYLAKGSRYDMDVKSERYSFIAINFIFSDNDDVFLSENFGKIPECEKMFCHAARSWSKKSRGYLSETLLALCEIHLAVLKKSQTEYVGSEMREKIERACRYMSEHKTDADVTVSSIASMVELSPAYFRRMFAKYTGTSPQSYFINLRIERAKELLALEWLSVSEVAEESGFSDFCYFSRIFKKYTGVSPAFYRKQFFNNFTIEK